MRLERIEEVQGSSKKSFFFDFYQVLKAISDNDLNLICGTDGVLYVIFLRHIMLLFAFMSTFNMLIILPIYLSGVPTEFDRYDESSGTAYWFLQVLTI